MKKKSIATTGIIPKLKQLLDALTDRYQKVIGVIDEALDSESMKDKIWAVDLILKRTPTEELTPQPEKKEKPAAVPIDTAALEQLSEQELLQQVRNHLQDWEP